MLYGRSGNNGKSTLLNIILQLVGVENASSLALQDTAERFRLYGIYGKVANIGDDIPETYLLDTSLFKKLVTGEPVIAEQKGQDPVTFKSYAKLFFSMNTLPRVNDKSRAFFSRILLIPLNKDFSAGKQDVSLKNREWSESEMECLVCHAMDGLKRLIRNGGFTRPASVTEALREYELENNPILEFLEEEQPELEGRPTSEVYQSFKYWCTLNGKRELSSTLFSKEIRIATGLEPKGRRHGGKLKKTYVRVTALPD